MKEILTRLRGGDPDDVPRCHYGSYSLQAVSLRAEISEVEGNEGTTTGPSYGLHDRMKGYLVGKL